LTSNLSTIPQKKVNEFFGVWGRLGHSQLLHVDQRGGKFSFSFVTDQSKESMDLLRKITKVTVEKHPSGAVSFISYYSATYIPVSSLYKKYRADFLDSTRNDTVDIQKLEIYLDELIQILKNR
jgi:hypothetical protein